MSKNIRTQIGKVIGKTLNSYHARVKPVIDDIKFKEQYQGRIIDCMVGEVDDNYIETPETDAPIVKLEHSKEGLVKVPSIKGKTILVDADGNETDTPAEGCRLVSVSEEEDNKLIILSNNKNLCPPKIYNSYITHTGFLQVNGGNNGLTEYVRIKPNTRYAFECINQDGGNTNNYRLNISWFDLNKEFISQVTITSREDTVSPHNAWFVRVHRDANPKIFRIQEGSRNDLSDEFIEYNQHKTEILLDEPLIKINNKVYDEIVGNKLIRRIGKIVLDGSDDNRLIPSTHGSENFTFYIGTHGLATSNSATNIISNNFPTLHQAWSNTQEGISIFSNKTIWITIRNSKLQTADLEGAKQWLKENPTTIYYELAEPIIEELPNGIVLQGFDDTTMYIENSITPIVQYGYNALIPYKEELSNQKEEVETNTLDIENNIIPYLMDMEFNLMLMEDNE